MTTSCSVRSPIWLKPTRNGWYFDRSQPRQYAESRCRSESRRYLHPYPFRQRRTPAKIAAEENISLEGIEIVNLRHDRETERRHRYAKILSEKKAREGVTYAEACEKMVDRNAFGMMMVATGDADAFVTGVYSRYSEVTKMAEQIIGIRPSYTHFGALNILTCKKGTFFIADTLINRHPSTEVLIDIARLTQDAVKFFAHEPVMAMLSYSNFGSDKQGSPLKVHDAIDYLHKNYPDMMVDGEMQVNFALDKKLRDDMYPFNKLKGKDVNTLIFPNLSSATVLTSCSTHSASAKRSARSRWD